MVAPRILNRGEDRVAETELKNLPREGGESAVAFAMGGPMNRSRGDRGSGSEDLERIREGVRGFCGLWVHPGVEIGL